MKILIDNVNLNSSSGPNSFGRKLKIELEKSDVHQVVEQDPDVQLSFISLTKKVAPVALRLDGIYFNTRQDWMSNNRPIKASFDMSDMVIYQSFFNKNLTEKYFGEKRNFSIIGNGTCIETISKIEKDSTPILDTFSEVWCCSSSWRPHKRLKENIRYFFEKSPKDSCLVVIGENPDCIVKNPRIFYAGQLPWEKCISLYKRSKVFIHLAFLDHCPNVVVDARAAGCNIVVSSSGGTKEISGPGSLIIEDIDWNMMPLDLYAPPDLDFSRFEENKINYTIDIKKVADSYLKSLSEISW